MAGLTGLANLGNTCYLNSCMQLISHTNLFNDFLESLDVDRLNDIEDSILLREWKSLRDLMWSQNCIVSPNRFVHFVRAISEKKQIELFSGFAQNDLPEFLMFIIDCFHNALKRPVQMSITGNPKTGRDILAVRCYATIKEMYSKTYSVLLKMFYGIHVSMIESDAKDRLILSVKPEPFCIISLPLLQNMRECTIYDLFDNYTIDEYMEGDNAWFNEATNAKQHVYKSLKFWNLPDILMVDLKRVDNYGRKIGSLVTTPLENVDLSKYVVGYEKSIYKYDLFGICNHVGNSMGGHYTAFVKNTNNKWYHFNDTNVNEIQEDKILTPMAYLFFYRKRINNK